MQMMRKTTLLFTLIISVASFGQINSGNPSVPFGSNSSYDYGMMPTNLPSSGTYGGSTEAANAYNSFKNEFVENCGSNEARVKFDQKTKTVSEGIAYTMLLSAYAADKDVFNRLWQYYKTRRNGNGVMHWKWNGCGTSNADREGVNGATDAELDAAMALIVADKQWGSSGQVHNYASDAVVLINAIKAHEVDGNTFNNGDGWGDAGGCRNPSYQSPAYARVYESFLEAQGQNSSGWSAIADGSANLLKINSERTNSGLPSNWCLTNGVPNNSCNASNTDPFSFGYDAVRAPWREGTDYLWFGTSSMHNVVNTQIDFWKGKGGVNQVQGGNSFNQNGSGSGDKNGTFIGMVGAQSLASTTNSTNQSFVNTIYTKNKNTSANDGYFNRVMRCLGLFVQTGNFWNPYSTALNGGNTPPTVSLTSPANNLQTCLGISYTLTANPSDADGISKVEFYDGNTLIRTDNSAPFSYTISSPTAGVKNYKAKAFDTKGASAFSSIVKVTVSTVQSTDGSTCGGNSSEGFNAAIDDFDSVDEVSLGATGDYGIFWWVADDAVSTYTMTRTSSNMKLDVANASPTYKVFGLGFGEGKSIDLTSFSNSDIKIELQNNTNDDVYLAIQLEDSDGGKAEYEIENESAITWDNKWQKIGLEIPKGQRVTKTLDLSKVPNMLGGFGVDKSVGSDGFPCNDATDCPAVEYAFDPSKLAKMVFIVNGGGGIPDQSDYEPVTGDLTFYYFSIGEISNSNSDVIKAGATLPPADTDGDSVDDAIDLCPNTPSGLSVNANGCADSQLDDDNDNVTNDKDNCPNTLPGTTVDAFGCKVNAVNTPESLGIHIFPNPAEGILFLNQETILMNSLSVLSTSGVEMLRKSNLSGTNQVDVSGLSKGVYLLVLNGENGTTQQRIVIK